MANRTHDWLRQADADLRHARTSLAAGEHEWSCFAAQQAAEKAVKALFMARGMEAWGHTVSALLGALGEVLAVPGALVEAAKSLDKHYIPTRYPNGFDSGAPTDFYTAGEARQAIRDAEAIVELCRGQTGPAGGG